MNEASLASSSDTVQRVRIEGPLAPDPLDRMDLDAVYPGFADGREINWAVALRLQVRNLTQDETIVGLKWAMRFGSTPFKAPSFGESGQFADIEIAPPVALVYVHTGANTVTDARNIGRPTIRQLLGLFYLRSKILTGSSIVWEGPVIALPDGMNRLAAALTTTEVTVNPESFDVLREAMRNLDLANLNQGQRLALDWLFESRRGPVVPIAYCNMWFAVVSIVDQFYTKSQKTKSPQIERVKGHLDRLAIPTAKRSELLRIFSQAYDLRNQIVHEGDRSCVGQDNLDELWSAVSDLLKADLGASTA